MLQLSAQKLLNFSNFCFYVFKFVYYGFSFGKWSVFGLQDIVNLL